MHIAENLLTNHVQKAFQLFATGGYGYTGIRKFFNENKIYNKSGHVFHLDKLKRILTDPFYYGLMRFCGDLYEGTHPPLISKKLFDKCQEVVKLKTCKVKNNKQLKEIVLRVSLPPHAAKKFLEWAENDASKEKQKSEGIVSAYKLKLNVAEEKLERLLEGYLDKIISSENYQKKKNGLVEIKSLLNSKIKEISANGVEWLEPFQEFVNSALKAHKIARAKNSGGAAGREPRRSIARQKAELTH